MDLQEDWILLHGLGREARHWGPLSARLGEHLPRARVWTPDHPGAGTDAHRHAPLSVREMVDDMRARLFSGTDAPARPVSLLGLSLGGMVAMEWAAHYPGEVARTVLINTSAGDLSPPFRRLRPGALRILLGAAGTRNLRKRERAGLRMTMNDAELITPELLEEWAQIQKSAPISNATFLRQLAASIRFRAPRSLACPTLILISSEDRMVDPRCSRAIAARLRTAEVAVHPAAGHDLPLEDPNWVAAQVAQWLRVSAGTPRPK